jgi:hypothetical protein
MYTMDGEVTEESAAIRRERYLDKVAELLDWVSETRDEAAWDELVLLATFNERITNRSPAA